MVVRHGATSREDLAFPVSNHGQLGDCIFYVQAQHYGKEKDGEIRRMRLMIIMTMSSREIHPHRTEASVHGLL
jgi:hypothetical protein